MTIHLNGLYLYPVKSLRGVAVRELALDRGRPRGDREYVLVDGDYRFMHQRDYPAMARISLETVNGGVVCGRDGQPPLRLEPGDVAGPIIYVRLWRRAVPTLPVSPEADRWFTRALGVPCRLLRFNASAPAMDVPGDETAAALQDATPFHLTSESSLADLCARMPEPLPMIRFRPNLVVSGAAPYAEDAWRRIRIGAVDFDWSRPCARCVLTTTDHLSGARGKEPLRTLATYRRRGSEVEFGHYLTSAPVDAMLQVGDQVTVEVAVP